MSSKKMKQSAFSKPEGSGAPAPPSQKMPTHVKAKYGVRGSEIATSSSSKSKSSSKDKSSSSSSSSSSGRRDSVLSEGTCSNLYRPDCAEADAKERYYKEGYMMKACGLQRSWKDRYFVLRTFDDVPHLAYFELPMSMEERCDKLLGKIPLHDAIMQIYPCGAQAGRVQNAYYFAVTPVDSVRTYIMCTETPDERSEWMAAMKRHGAMPGQQVSEESLRVVDGSSYEGFLDKMAPNEKADSWKLRYFAVMPHKHKIYYYESRAAAIKGKHIGRVRWNNKTVITVEESAKVGRKHCFSVSSGTHKRRFVLAAPNRHVLEEWREVLQGHIDSWVKKHDVKH